MSEGRSQDSWSRNRLGSGYQKNTIKLVSNVYQFLIECELHHSVDSQKHREITIIGDRGR